MSTAVLVPKLGMTMTEGTVAEWLIPDGGEIKQGEILYRLETEKIQFEVEAEVSGTIRQLVPEGAVLPPGTVVGYILATGEALPEGVYAVAAPTTTVEAGSPNAAATAPAARLLEAGRIASSPIARRLAKEAGILLVSVPGSGPGGRIIEADVLAAQQRRSVEQVASARFPATAASAAGSGPVIASPLARRLAEQLGVDLSSVEGTGPGGRITKEDVDSVARDRPAASTEPAADRRPAKSGSQHAPGDVIPMRSMRKVIAERMHASLQQMAQLTMGIEVAMDEASRLRAQLAEEWADEGVKPSYTDLVIKAVAKALLRHPLLNARITEAGIELLAEVHAGMAVALDGGLVVPVIRDADRRPLKEIAVESSRLAAAARENKLTLDEMSGGTISITSLGMYDVDFFTPIINPPNVAIIGVGRIHDATAWEAERPVRRLQMTLSLTIDHRAVDGAPAAAFLRAVRDLLQAPYRLLV